MKWKVLDKSPDLIYPEDSEDTKKEKGEKSVVAADVLEKTPKPTQTSLVKSEQKLDFSEAVEAAGRWTSSWHFRREQRRKIKNIEEETAALEQVKEAVETGVAIQKQMIEGYKVTGNYDNLPPLERKKIELEDKKLDTEMMREDFEQEKIRQEMTKSGEEDSKVETTLTTEEKHEKAMEAERRKLEYELAIEAMREMMTIKRLTERAQYLTEWQEKIQKEHPDVAEDIINTFERLQVEGGLKQE